MINIADSCNKTIYIYGAGYRGQYCYDIIKHKANVKAFLVSEDTSIESRGGGTSHSDRSICRKIHEPRDRFYTDGG